MVPGLGPGHASKDHLRDDESDNEGDDHVEICCDKPDAEPEYYSEHGYYSEEMTHTDDAHSLVSGVTRVFCVKVRFKAVLPNRGSPDTTLSYIHSPAPYFSYLGESPNGGPTHGPTR